MFNKLFECLFPLVANESICLLVLVRMILGKRQDKCIFWVRWLPSAVLVELPHIFHAKETLRQFIHTPTLAIAFEKGTKSNMVGHSCNSCPQLNCTPDQVIHELGELQCVQHFLSMESSVCDSEVEGQLFCPEQRLGARQCGDVAFFFCQTWESLIFGWVKIKPPGRF